MNAQGSTATTDSDYEVIREHARGGMGVVFACRKRRGRFERVYALKRLHPHVLHQHQARQRFLEEGRIAGAIRHANVVSVVDVGVDTEGPFLVMDFVEGLSLSQVARTLAGRGLCIPAATALEICRQTALGLHAAHVVRTTDGVHDGIVHRDATPQNLLVGFDGVVRVADFGVAKALSAQSRTTTGVLKGKLGYMSPEQLSFLGLDRRSDLFTLGVVLFELLAGRSLYSHPRQILDDPPPDIGEVRTDLPPEVTELVFDLLAKDRELRPKTALIVAHRLGDILAFFADSSQTDLATFMERHFSAERDQAKSQLARAIAELDGGHSGVSQQGSEIGLEQEPTESQGPSPLETRTLGTGSHRPLVKPGLAISLIVLLALGVALYQESLGWGAARSGPPASRADVPRSPADEIVTEGPRPEHNSEQQVVRDELPPDRLAPDREELGSVAEATTGSPLPGTSSPITGNPHGSRGRNPHRQRQSISSTGSESNASERADSSPTGGHGRPFTIWPELPE